MAQPNDSTVTPQSQYYSNAAGNAPSGANLGPGELAINVPDLKIWVGNPASGSAPILLSGSLGAQNSNAVSITGGTIDGTSVGSTTAAAGRFTALTHTGFTTLGYVKNSAAGVFSSATSVPITDITGLGTLATQNANAVAITGGSITNAVRTGGTIDNTPIGATTANTGKFTTLQATSLNMAGVVITDVSGNLSVDASPLDVIRGGTAISAPTGYLKGTGAAYSQITSIPNTDLANSAVTIGTSSVSLGGSTLTLAGLTTVTVTQNPTGNLDLATKQYVDSATAAGLVVHAAVQVATTAAITLSGLQVLDTYTTLANDRVLVKNQADSTTNGNLRRGSRRMG